MTECRKRTKRSLLTAAILFFLLCAGGLCIGALEQENEIRQAEASTNATGETVLLGGMPVGIYMETDGVMVLSTESMEGIMNRQRDWCSQAIISLR